jgi:acetyltransferase-like isoleucine patch superfamily enzyme
VCGEGVHVGANAVCREGTTVGSYALVGIGAVVVRDVAPGDRVAGNPARPLASKKAP